MKFFHVISQRRIVACFAAACLLAAPLAPATEPLIVVEDHGGTSAAPYYQALKPQPRSTAGEKPPLAFPVPPALTVPVPPSVLRPVSETDMLPVRSFRLTPGTVARRVIDAPGLPPFFLVGDDARSVAWLRQRAASLRERGAVGLVVNVAAMEGMARLRAAAPGLTLTPASADDLAERLGVRHYPALITGTHIEP